MKDFKKFSMYEDHETTASDSTNAYDEGREDKRRIEKDAITHKIYKSAGLETRMHWKSGYIAGATAENNILREQLAKERELRKELVDKLQICHKSLSTYGEHPLIDSWIKALIQKAKGT